jgi:CTP synthase (UTP-ammonia lyase)
MNPYGSESAALTVWLNLDVYPYSVCPRYEVNPKYVAELEAAGLKFVGRDVDNERMEVSSLRLLCF